MSHRAIIAAVPHLGLVESPSRVEPLADLFNKTVWVKRDDELEALHGGSKPRKIDYLLAEARYVEADAWAALGAIGSGNLVALVEAARQLGKRFEAHLFWEPPSKPVVDNLAFIASYAGVLRHHRSRFAVALRHPALVRGTNGTFSGTTVVPPGSTSARSMIGAVQAGLELADQMARDASLVPEAIFVPLGSGGLAVGLSVGLGLARVDTEVVAVAAVERVFATEWRLRRLHQALLDELALFSIAAPRALRLRIDRSQLGRGYAQPTSAAKRAMDRFAEVGIDLDPVYTAKAAAALLEAPTRPSLLWLSSHARPLPHDDDWRERLPTSLRLRLEGGPHRRLRRRTVLVGAGAVVAAVALRLTGYPDAHLEVLSDGQAALVRAAAEAMFPEAADPTIANIPATVDRYLRTMPETTLRELDAALFLIEHFTPIAGAFSRFSSLPVPARRDVLDALARRDDVVVQAYRALRELCMLGHYADPASWPAIGYAGPMVAPARPWGHPERPAWPTYDALMAPQGTLPEGVA